MVQGMIQEAAGPRYMSRFNCIAERCEDPCCSGLEIPVSAERYAAMKGALSGDAETAPLLARLVPDPETGGARIPVGETRRCPFFEENGLCGVQRRHGESLLPDPCAVFPRVFLRQPGRMEVSASLACPETARLCLLAEDALEVVPLVLDTAKRWELAAPLPAPSDAYARHADQVRTVALGLLGRREYPMGARLLFLAQLALRLEGFYFPGTRAFDEKDGDGKDGDGQDGVHALTRLQGVLEAFSSRETLDALSTQFSALALPAGLCAGVLASALRTRLRAGLGDRFTLRIRTVLEALGASGVDPDPEQLGRAYEARRDALDGVDPQRVEQYFRNFSQNHWLREPFTASRLSTYVFTLATRMALLRLVLAGHPEVASLGSGDGGGSPGRRARLDAAAVETFQVIAKHVERHVDFVTLVKALSGTHPEETFAKTVLMARFY